MTIRDGDGKEVEKIVMHELKDKPAMHALMAAKGFEKKTQSEIQEIQQKVAEKATEAEKSYQERKARLAEERQRMAAKRAQLRAGRTGQALDTRHEALVKMHKRREEDYLLRQVRSGPGGASMMYLYALVATGALALIGLLSKSKRAQQRRNRTQRAVVTSN